MAVPAAADRLRIATWHAALTRDGPGLLLRDLLAAEDADLAAIVAGLAGSGADILVLTDIDYDAGGAALAALAARMGALGADYPHHFAARPNTGLGTGRDVDGDGRRGGPRDAQGYGTYAGEGGMAVLSRLPVDAEAVRDLSGLLWRDLPGSLIAADDPARDVQRLSSSGHWIVPVAVPDGTRLDLLVWHATPPVFDGPEDRNGRRNADETRLWQHVLDGALGPPPTASFVLTGNANLDPDRGEGRHEAIRALLSDPRLADPLAGGASVDWTRLGLGPMRVSYLLPSSGLRVVAAGTAARDPAAGDHRLLWIEVETGPPDAP
nr:endonuclease/exonuclease/phosphatase family protein [Roseivivax isoporae]